MDRNWTLWHPACRPSHAHPLLAPPHGFEDLTLTLALALTLTLTLTQAQP